MQSDQNTQCSVVLSVSVGHIARIQELDFNGSFQVADIHKIELKGSDRHIVAVGGYVPCTSYILPVRAGR